MPIHFPPEIETLTINYTFLDNTPKARLSKGSIQSGHPVLASIGVGVVWKLLAI